MKLKTTKVKGPDNQEIELAEVRNGMPVYVLEDNSEVEGDLPTLRTKYKTLAEERDRLRAEHGELSKLADQVKGLGDLDTLKDAVEVRKNLTAGKLIAAGDAQKVRDDAVREAQTKLQSLETSLADALRKIDERDIAHTFTLSPFLNGSSKKVRVHPEAVRKLFGEHFRMENGSVIAYQGEQRVMSRKEIGEVAKFDEALEILINASPFKDDILAGTNANGSGATTTGRDSGNGKSMPRKQFEALPPAEKAAAMKNGVQLTE